LALSTANPAERGQDVSNRVDLLHFLWPASSNDSSPKIFDARLQLRLAFQVGAAKTQIRCAGRQAEDMFHPVAAVQADAEKIRRTIKRLLVEPRED